MLIKQKYLGVFLIAGRQFKTSLSEAICKFYKSVNDILSKAKGHMDEMVLLHLFEAHCKPLLVYACECFAFTKSEYARLSNAWNRKFNNRIFWKLFKVNDSNWLRDIFLYAGCLPLQADIDIRQYSFLSKLTYSNNKILTELYALFAQRQIRMLCNSYNVPQCCSIGDFRANICARFFAF